jgi:pimeloyl-ACP methyl ester carboxylesterase
MVREAFITHARGTARYLEAGAGRPAVLLHAFPLSADMWRPQLEHPPDGWRLIAPDFRGFGKTPVVDAGRTAAIDDYAADIEACLDGLSIERAVIGGISMGGYVTFALLRRNRSRFAGAVLADTRSAADTAAGRDGRRAMLDAVRRQGAGAVADLMVPKLMSQGTASTRPDVVAWVRRTIETTPVPAIESAIEALMSRPDSTPDLARVPPPCLVIVGAEDGVTPPADSESMHRAIAGSRLVVVPGAGHLSNLESPEAFSRALTDVLASA